MVILLWFDIETSTPETRTLADPCTPRGRGRVKAGKSEGGGSGTEERYGMAVWLGTMDGWMVWMDGVDTSSVDGVDGWCGWGGCMVWMDGVDGWCG